MIVCAYCSTPLEAAARTCSQCGAPRTGRSAAAPPPPPGFVPYVDAWSGFSVHRPEGWEAHPGPQGVRFVSENGSVLAIGKLPPHATATPSDHVRGILQGFPPGDVTVMRDEPAATTVRFQGGPWSGQIQVRMSGRGGLYVYGRTQEATLDIHAACNQLLASLTPIEPAPRAPFRDPHEGSFHVMQPAGWVVHHTFAQPQGQRTPWCRVVADPEGRTFVACEVDAMVPFLDRPREAPAPQGFFATLGRMAQQVDEAMSGATRMPFQGMRPAIEHHYVPRWIAAIPGSVLRGIEELSPTAALARMGLPDGTTRVIRVEGIRLPFLGPEHWGAVMAGFVQAPDAELDRLLPVLLGIQQSFTIDPRWQQQERARVQQMQAMQHQQHMQQMRMSQQLHQQRMNDIAAMGAASTASWQANQDISDMQMQSWRAQQGMSDHAHHQTINGIRETADYVGAGGQVWNAPEVDRLWTNGQGDFVGGGATFDPGIDWTELKKL
ncbi:MAG: hypothetical protein R3F61_22695 [Myxococcota bacterium]